MPPRKPHRRIGSMWRRLTRGPQQETQLSFPPGRLEDWDDHGIQFAHLFQTSASAVVASWEVAAAELHRALSTHRPALDSHTWVERLSDSLVPTLTPLQDAERAARGVWSRATRQASETGNPTDAVKPLAPHLAELGLSVPEGWENTVAYLVPLADALEAPLLPDRLLAQGRNLGELFSQRSEELAGALLAASRSPRLEASVLAALDDTRMALQEDLEVSLARGTELLLAACAR